MNAYERIISDLPRHVGRYWSAKQETEDARHYLYEALREAYAGGGYTLGDLARASGLSVQRVWQIVNG